ncbi:phosphofructokinase family protein [Scenedesmus sp. NREL 46B-D3]|nr:phosphofructokinase family protein [Scenedesmus sp. NREL 46B-D3]
MKVLISSLSRLHARTPAPGARTRPLHSSRRSISCAAAKPSGSEASGGSNKRQSQRKVNSVAAAAGESQPAQADAGERAASAAAAAAAARAAGGPAMMSMDGRLLFAIPPVTLATPTDEVLQCPTMRDILGPPRHTSIQDNIGKVWEGRYVSDDDRAALNLVEFGSYSIPGDHSGSDSSSATARNRTLNSGVFAGPAASFSSVSSMDAGQQGEDAAGGDATRVMPLPPYALRAGPREQIYFDPATVTAAIISTGGICPGMNDIIQALCKRLADYGVHEESVLGIRYGVRGFTAHDYKPIVLTADRIEGIHHTGGSIIGTSNVHAVHTRRRQRHKQRQLHGPSSSDEEEDWDSSTQATASGSASAPSDEEGGSGGSGNGKGGQPDVLGSMLGAQDELEQILDKLEFCIDNDVMLMDKTFGFDTVVQASSGGGGRLRLLVLPSRQLFVFGRRSGFIALQASLASEGVDICLIPEERFELDGPCGVLAFLKGLLERNGHAVICVAEGAGQELMHPGEWDGEPMQLDEAGNPLLGDIGTFLKKAIKAAIPDATLKYIDPTYMVQAVPCTSPDHIYCRVLGMHAVDAAFAGYTGVMVGQVNSHSVLLPSSVITQSARKVDVNGRSWTRLRAAIGQPLFRNSAAPARKQ